MSFDKFGLCSEILRALSDESQRLATKIQSLSIPKIMEGHDLIASAQTGTGKTASFLLPILDRLSKQNLDHAHKKIKVLILAPTRELASQVQKNVEIYARYLPLRSTVLFGGTDYTPQIELLERGVDIIVATPGRLIDLMDKGYLDFSELDVLVLDEADRMMEMGFMSAIKRIMAQTAADKQILCFSATFSENVKIIANTFLKTPTIIHAETANSTAHKLTHVAHPVDVEKKRDLLTHLIRSSDSKQILVFTSTKLSAEKLSKELLTDDIENRVLHSSRSQAYRSKSLELFRSGEIRVLVATDVASRGIDIESLPIVINYELPNLAEDYVHRVGRSARAGQAGVAISLITDRDVFHLLKIEKLIQMKIKRKKIKGFEPLNYDPERVAREFRDLKRQKATKKRDDGNSNRAKTSSSRMKKMYRSKKKR